MTIKLINDQWCVMNGDWLIRKFSDLKTANRFLDELIRSNPLSSI